MILVPWDVPTYSDDHDFVDDNDEENGRPWETGSEEKVQQQQWRGDGPIEILVSSRPRTGQSDETINVSDVEDLTRERTSSHAGPDKLDENGCCE